jgi:hypothetical protein
MKEGNCEWGEGRVGNERGRLGNEKDEQQGPS